MKDIFGNSRPVKTGQNEWWFNGRFIHKQDDERLPPYCSFPDSEFQPAEGHYRRQETIKFCLENPNPNPTAFPRDYLGQTIV